MQDPREALFPDMPESAIQATPVDHCVPAKAIPALIRELAVTAVKLGKKPGVRKNLLTETKIAALQIQGEEVTDAIGKRSTFTCPECSGALWEMDERKMLRYRCHIGHAYTAESLLADQEDSFERALSAAVRTLEDRARLLGSMAEFAKQKGWRTSSQSFASKAREAKEHSARLRSVLTGTR
ncbi:MAG: two-component system, chemotaxis family, protein-glutamate methylesterase/glutaminase [Chthoniobacter sp.]|nr:two-component system, chemotaxis family, protein-glutamate methylesterase/glutaminase [Chthoniobacter sp.]